MGNKERYICFEKDLEGIATVTVAYRHKCLHIFQEPR